ncbi:MAG: hypothetical protein AAGF94_06740 [Pseudomonadota bacterium]
MLNTLFDRADARWVLATFSVMGILNLASRMNNVYEAAGVLGVAMAFIGIGGWIHGIASIARAAQQRRGKKVIATLMIIYFGLGCAFALPLHFFVFNDPANAAPVLYALLQLILALTYLVVRLGFQHLLYGWYVRYLILGYATYSCLFQSVSPKASTESFASSLGLDLTMSFVGSTFLIFSIAMADILAGLIKTAKQRFRPSHS